MPFILGENTWPASETSLSNLSRYYRLDIEFHNTVPRLDSIQSIQELLLKAQEDPSISKVIDNIVRYAIISIFYFELGSLLERYNGSYIGTGFILCSLRPHDPVLKVLLDQLVDTSAVFYLNGYPILGTIGDSSFVGRDGSFRKRVELNISDRFAIILKQSDTEPCNISGSPYSIEKLIIAQGLNTHFGTANHSKRKRSTESSLFRRKR